MIIVQCYLIIAVEIEYHRIIKIKLFCQHLNLRPTPKTFYPIDIRSIIIILN